MGKRSSIDKAIRNIMQWADRPEWVDVHADIIDAHLGPVCDRMDITLEELKEELTEYEYDGMLFGIMFEDTLCRHFPPDGRNIVDDYLQHRGWRESAPGRSYLRALKDSVLSLYEVVETAPGRHCDLRDLVRGGKTLRVFEKAGTQSMVKWDRIAARVLKLNGKYIFSGGILPFPQPAAQSLLRGLDDSRNRLRKELSKATDKKVVDEMLASGEFDKELLQQSCPAFTTIWLVHVLGQLRTPLPEMVNYDGESLVFTETHFPLLTENPEEIAQRLDAETDWERDDPDEPSWTWIPPDSETEETATSSSVQSAEPVRSLIRGWLDLKSAALVLHTNSAGRTEKGKKVLQALLHGLIGAPLSKLQTPEQMMAEHEARQPRDKEREDAANAIDPDIAAELIHEYQDEHSRRSRDAPAPMLDNKTPRQCANSKKDRDKVIEWLKYLENMELRRAADQGHKPYDSHWMWEELKLSE